MPLTIEFPLAAPSSARSRCSRGLGDAQNWFHPIIGDNTGVIVPGVLSSLVRTGAIKAIVDNYQGVYERQP